MPHIKTIQMNKYRLHQLGWGTKWGMNHASCPRATTPLVAEHGRISFKS